METSGLRAAGTTACSGDVRGKSREEGKVNQTKVKETRTIKDRKREAKHTGSFKRK